jgi:hypothetical protein
MTIVAIYRRRHILHSFKVGNYYFVFMSLVLAQALGMFFLVNGAITYFWIVVGILFLSTLILILLRLVFFTAESWKETFSQLYYTYHNKGVEERKEGGITSTTSLSNFEFDRAQLSMKSLLADKVRLTRLAFN